MYKKSNNDKKTTYKSKTSTKNKITERMMEHPARTVDDKPHHQQPDQDDKKFPRRCLHALASLAGAGIRVKADTQGLSGKSNQHANAFPNLIKNLSRNLAGFLGFTLLPIDGPELI